MSSREHILQTTIALIRRGDDPQALTVRQIAAAAGVGVGAINYHFQSKDNLLNEAVMTLIAEVAADWQAPAAADPVTRLRATFKDTSRIAFRYHRMTRIAIEHTLLHGTMQVQQMILPILREIFPDYTEQQHRLLAFQLVVAMQVAFIRPEAFHQYAGIDPLDDAQREAAIDILIDHLIHGRNPND